MSGSGAELGRFHYTIAADATVFNAALQQTQAKMQEFSGKTVAELNKVAVAADKPTKEFQELTEKVIRLEAENKKMRTALGQIAAELTRMAEASNRSSTAVERNTRSMVTQNAVVKRLIDQVKGLVFAYVGISTIRGLVNTLRDFENLERQTRRVTSSNEQAARVISDLRREFQGSSISVSDATKAYQTLVQAGISPTFREMRSLANIGETVGATIEETATAVGSAVQKQFDPLRALGFQITEQGNKVRITFQGVTRTVTNDAQSIRAAIDSIGSVQLAGASDNADTLTEAFNRLKNMAEEAAIAFGESGFTADLVKLINKLADLVVALGPVITLLGTGFTGALRLASAGIDLFITGLDAIITMSRAVGQELNSLFSGSWTERLARVSSYLPGGQAHGVLADALARQPGGSQAGGAPSPAATLRQGLAQAAAGFAARSDPNNPTGSAPPANGAPGSVPRPSTTTPRALVSGGRGVRTSTPPRAGGGGGEDPRARELESYIEKLGEEASAAETNNYQAQQARIQRVIEEMRKAGGALARQADELAGKIQEVEGRRSQALSDRAVRDMREENELIRIRINLGEQAADVQREVNQLQQQGVTVSAATRTALEAEIRTRQELSDALKEQTDRNREIASGLSNAFGNAFEAIQQPGAKLSDILKQLEKDLLALGNRVLVMKPLEKLLDTLVNGSGGSGGSGGGGIGGALSSVVNAVGGAFGFGGVGGAFTGSTSLPANVSGPVTAGYFHEGGEVGKGGTPTMANPKQWATAPRFYTGLAANEFRAILEQGEQVLNGRQQQQVQAAVRGGGHSVHFHGVVDGDTFKRSEGKMMARTHDSLRRAGRNL